LYLLGVKKVVLLPLKVFSLVPIVPIRGEKPQNRIPSTFQATKQDLGTVQEGGVGAY